MHENNFRIRFLFFSKRNKIYNKRYLQIKTFDEYLIVVILELGKFSLLVYNQYFEIYLEKNKRSGN